LKLDNNNMMTTYYSSTPYHMRNGPEALAIDD